MNMATVNVSICEEASNSNRIETTRKHRCRDLVLLVNFYYYAGVSPFRASCRSSRKTLSVSRTRKVTYCIIHCSVLLYQLIGHIYPKVRTGLESGGPKLSFNLVHSLAFLGATISTFHTLWCRKDTLKQVIDETSTQKWEGLRHPWWLYVLETVTILAAFVSVVTYSAFPGPQTLKLFGTTLDIFGCAGISNHSSSVNIWVGLVTERQCVFTKVAVVLYLLLRMCMYLVGGFGYAMMLVRSSVIYRISEQLAAAASTVNPDGYSLFESYGMCKHMIGLLNQISPLAVVFIIPDYVMYLSLMLAGTINVSSLGLIGTSISYMILNTSSLLLAAEANRKMREVERVIIQSLPNKESAHVATTLANLPGENGLSGGCFFVVSYQFLGSIMTSVFTYVLVVQQLKSPT